jgi:hypothetical protein
MKRKNKILVLLYFPLLFSFSTVAQYDLSMRAGLSYGLIGSESFYNYQADYDHNKLSYLYKPSYSYELNFSRTDNFLSLISGLRIIRYSGTELRSIKPNIPRNLYYLNRNNDLVFYTIGIPINFGFKANKVSCIFGINFNRSIYGSENIHLTSYSTQSTDGYHYTTHHDTISYVNKIDFRQIKMNELILRLKIDLNDNIAVDFGVTVNMINARGIEFGLKKASFFDFGISYNIKEFNLKNNNIQTDDH